MGSRDVVLRKLSPCVKMSALLRATKQVISRARTGVQTGASSSIPLHLSPTSTDMWHSCAHRQAGTPRHHLVQHRQTAVPHGPIRHL